MSARRPAAVDRYRHLLRRVAFALLAQIVLFYSLPNWWWGRGVAALSNLSFAVLAIYLRGEGIVLDDLGLRRPSLDDVFLAKTGRTLEGAATGEDGASAR